MTAIIWQKALSAFVLKTRHSYIIFMTHITFFLLFLNHKKWLKNELWSSWKHWKGKCEGLYSLVTYDSHQKHITKQWNRTGIKKQMCVCLQHACPCMSVHGCTDTTRGQHLAVKSNKTKEQRNVLCKVSLRPNASQWNRKKSFNSCIKLTSTYWGELINLPLLKAFCAPNVQHTSYQHHDRLKPSHRSITAHSIHILAAERSYLKARCWKCYTAPVQHGNRDCDCYISHARLFHDGAISSGRECRNRARSKCSLQVPALE